MIAFDSEPTLFDQGIVANIKDPSSYDIEFHNIHCVRVLRAHEGAGGGVMICDYCDTRKRGYKTNVGKPIIRNKEGHFIEIEHDCGSPALPNRDEWRMTFWQFGIGLYASIKYCPMCGRKLPPKTAEEAAQAVGRKGHDE